MSEEQRTGLPESADDIIASNTELNNNESNNDEPSAQSKNPLKKTYIALAVLAVACVGLGGAVFFVQQQNVAMTQQLAVVLEQKLQQTEQANQAQQRTIQTINGQLVSLEGENQRLQTQLSVLPEQQAQVFNQYEEWISQSLAKTEESWQDSSLAWRLAEIDFLLNSAHQTVLARGDAATAIAMLQLADRKVATIYQKDAQSVRQKIAESVLMLQQWQPVDVIAIYNQLLALEQVMMQWQWQANTALSPVDETQATQEVLPWYKRYAEFVKVRRVSDIDSDALLQPQQLEHVRFLLLSSTASAKNALSNQDQALFDLAINDLSTWAQRFLTFDQQQMVLMQTQAWQQVKLHQERPSVYEPISEFSTWKQELMPQ